MKKELLQKVKDFIESDDDKAFLVAKAPKKQKIEDVNAPSRWNMRIWDDDKKEWFCQSDQECLAYYGFDIRGGEVTVNQWLPKLSFSRHLIWEQSTGLKDKNGKEIYEGDIIVFPSMLPAAGRYAEGKAIVRWLPGGFVGNGTMLNALAHKHCVVIGNIHENPELVGSEE